MTAQSDKLYQVENKEVGYRENNGSSNHNNLQKYSPAVPGLEWSQNQAWCMTFQSWCLQTAGIKTLGPVTASTAAGYSWYGARSRVSPYPAAGALVFFGPGAGSHVGFVYAYDADYIYTIEGNTNTNGSAEGDGVYRKKRARRDAYVYGYGYPNFTGGIVTADPVHHVAGSTYKATASLNLAPAAPPADALPQASFIQVLWSATHSEADENRVKPGPSNPKDDVGVVQDALVKGGWMKAGSFGRGGFGSTTQAAYAKYQVHLGYSGGDANGVPGPTSFVRLGVETKSYVGTQLTGTYAPDFVDGTTPPPVVVPTAWVTSVPINNKTGVSYARYTGGGNIDQWIAQALKLKGITAPAAVHNWTVGIKTAAARESSFNPNACNRNDSNNTTPAGYSRVADFGDGYPGGNLGGVLTNYQCSRGVVQCIPQTFARYHCPGASDMIYNPVASITAAIGYVATEYGVADDGHDLAARVGQFDPDPNRVGGY